MKQEVTKFKVLFSLVKEKLWLEEMAEQGYFLRI